MYSTSILNFHFSQALHHFPPLSQSWFLINTNQNSKVYHQQWMASKGVKMLFPSSDLYHWQPLQRLWGSADWIEKYLTSNVLSGWCWITWKENHLWDQQPQGKYETASSDQCDQHIFISWVVQNMTQKTKSYKLAQLTIHSQYIYWY